MGLGTFRLSPQEAENSVRAALKVGYRLIDTANSYGNERAIGRAIQESGVPREELFVSTIYNKALERKFINNMSSKELGIVFLYLQFFYSKRMLPNSR